MSEQGRKPAIEVTLEVRWGDMDALGHVNNATYLTYLESARIAYFERTGVFAQMETHGIGPILASTTCDFLKPVTYPATLVVTARVAKLGNTSFPMDYEIRDVKTGELCARATAITVMYDYRKKQKCPVPEEIRKAISALEGI